jgi:hypothetical protein
MDQFRLGEVASSGAIDLGIMFGMAQLIPTSEPRQALSIGQG